jgi:hypothetical protein
LATIATLSAAVMRISRGASGEIALVVSWFMIPVLVSLGW